jgi:hypothetical protein
VAGTAAVAGPVVFDDDDVREELVDEEVEAEAEEAEEQSERES